MFKFDLNKVWESLNSIINLKSLLLRFKNDRYVTGETTFCEPCFSVHNDQRVIATEKDEDALVDSVETHPNLERIGLWNRKLNEAAVVDFVWFAPKLKSLQLHDCGIFVTSSLLTKLVNVRKCYQEYQNKLELRIEENEGNDLGAIIETQTQQYLSVKLYDKL